MERTQIYFDKEEKETLMKVARKKGVPMAEIVREAVGQYLTREKVSDIDRLQDTCGIWKDRTDIEDSDGFIADMRKSWASEREGE